MRLLVGFALASLAAAGTFEGDVRLFLRAHCVGCHGSQANPAAKLNLARFSTEASVRDDLATWAKVLDVVAAEQMPPAPMRPPAGEARDRFTRWVEGLLDSPGGDADPGRPVLRRLTRLEYNNTVRDLLRLDRDVFMMPERLPYTKSYFDPALGRMPRSLDVEVIEYGQQMPVLLKGGGLPGETRAEHGFSNRGDGLNVSPLLMERYLAVAADVSASPDLATRSPVFRVLATPAAPQVLRQRFGSLLERAFRRPALPGEVERYLKPFDVVRAGGGAWDAGVRASVRAVLSSPSFLLRTESSRSTGNALDGYALASRLSYFLWSSMPDDELFELAREGTLSDPGALASQARRMLRDRKARELSDSFALQWLQLNEMFGAQPDVERFKHYYLYDAFGTNKGNLALDMIAEALLLFETVLVEDRPILDFVDARYTWANTRLLKHYGLAGVFSKEATEATLYGTRKGPSRFFRIQLPDRTRGGVFSLGATLTMNSTPLRTSPVFRGAWALEAIFNRPPPPPPNVNVGTLEEQGSDEAKLSVRAKLESHRKNPACASCHNRIDPLGFAMENYDPVGVWRTSDGGAPVDASGTLSGGRVFRDPGAFKDALLARKEEFVRGFSEHLLSYALNRKVEHFDRPAVRKILTRSEAGDYRFGQMIEAVVQSYPFRHVRPDPKERK